MIKNIKIYGERNSGTNYLTQLLKQNIKNQINIYSFFYKSKTGWKHGFPDKSKYSKHMLEETLFIFIVRDLEPWLKSMFKNPYHYKRPQDTSQFLMHPLDIYDERGDHDVNINKREHQKIMDLRYDKIREYKEFYGQINNGIFINLSDVQTNIPKFFQCLNTEYKIPIEKTLKPITKHTKTKKKNINRTYDDIELPLSLIEPQKNRDLETFIEGLKSEYVWKSDY